MRASGGNPDEIESMTINSIGWLDMKSYSHDSHCGLTSSERTAKYKEYDAHVASVLSVSMAVLKLNTIAEILFRAVVHLKEFGEPIAFATMTTSWRGALQLNDKNESETQTLFTKASTLMRPIVQYPHGEMLVSYDANRAKQVYSFEKCTDHDLATEIILREYLPEAASLVTGNVTSLFM